MSAITTYEQMFAIANAQTSPMTFLTDLTVHDRQSVTDHPNRPFAWLLYEHGTHLLWLDKPTHDTLTTLRCFEKCFTGGEHMWFTFDGDRTIEETNVNTIRRTIDDMLSSELENGDD